MGGVFYRRKVFIMSSRIMKLDVTTLQSVSEISIMEKTWRDKLYGNTYQSMRITVLHNQHGPCTDIVVGEFTYRTSLEQYAGELLGITEGLYGYCKARNIFLNRSTMEGLKKDVEAWGKA